MKKSVKFFFNYKKAVFRLSYKGFYVGLGLELVKAREILFLVRAYYFYSLPKQKKKGIIMKFNLTKN